MDQRWERIERHEAEKMEEAQRRHYMVFGFLALWIVIAGSFIHQRNDSQQEANGPRIEPPASHRLMEVDSALGLAAKR